jgi:uncharacterized protein YjiS (DUF1127 family)
MSTIHGNIERRQVTTRRQVFSPLEIYWAAFQEWRKRTRLQADLIDLSDRELMDIGISRGEIDYVASHRGSDPRGIRSSEWLRYLPTLDGQIGPTDFR